MGLCRKNPGSIFKFFTCFGPESILIGCGQLERCVDKFYREIRASMSKDRVAIAGVLLR